MPIVATPTTPVIVSKDQIRMFIRDYANKNILIDDVQFNDAELNLALEMAVSDYNSVTPQTMLTPSSFPQHLKYLLMVGTARFLMMSESFLQIRNQSTYQDGEISPIGLDDKMAQYAQLAQQLKAEWDDRVRQVKTQNNMEAAYNSVGSGYKSTSRFQS
jgi:hypothetical protein